MLVKMAAGSEEGEQSTCSCWSGLQRVREQERRSEGTVTGGRGKNLSFHASYHMMSCDPLLRQSGPANPMEQLQEERLSVQVPG